MARFKRDLYEQSFSSFRRRNIDKIVLPEIFNIYVIKNTFQRKYNNIISWLQGAASSNVDSDNRNQSIGDIIILIILYVPDVRNK